MTDGYFVTGMDTGIGKTIVSTILAVGLKARYWKPIQTGSKEGTDSAFVQKWIGHFKIVPESYIFSAPASPHIAAESEGVIIQPQRCTDDFLKTDGPLVIEGAGGALVPINDSFLMVDLMRKFQLPVIVVASTRLGAINHTLLTLEALRHRKIEIAGVITVGEESASYQKSIEHFGAAKIYGHIPLCDSFSLAWFQAMYHELSIPMAIHTRRPICQTL